MDIRSGRRALSLIYKLLIERAPDPSAIPYYPQKLPASGKCRRSRAFRAVRPERLGIRSSYLTEYLHALENSETTAVHSVLVVTAGKTVLSASAPGFSATRRHITYSMAKSVVALAAGLLYDEGVLRIDECLYRIFPEYPALLVGKKREITIRDLLTMGVAINFNEANTVTDEDYLTGYFEASLREDSGTAFHYNSMTTHVLAAALERIAGEPLDAYLDRKLFRPMKITDWFWEKTRSDIIKGGWGLYLTPVDMAKLGMLILGRGVYRKRRYISAEWIDEMTSVQRTTDKAKGHYDYGYQIWVDSISGHILMNGMLGQDVLILPEADTVIVLTAGNHELFQISDMLAVTDRFFTGTSFRSSRLRIARPGAFRKLRNAEKHFFADRSFLTPRQIGEYRKAGRKEIRAFAGKRFTVTDNGFSVLPLFTQILQNHYDPSIKEIGFEGRDQRDCPGDGFVLILGNGIRTYRIPVGLRDFAYGLLWLDGEEYRIGAKACFVRNEDDEKILKILLIFPETAGELRIKIFYDREKRYISVRESPGYAVATSYINRVSDAARSIFTVLLNYISPDLLQTKIADAFCPVCRIIPTPAESTEAEKDAAVPETPVIAESADPPATDENPIDEPPVDDTEPA